MDDKTHYTGPEYKHFYWLDLLRFLAALEVVLCHGRGFWLPEYGALSSAEQSTFTFIFYTLTRMGGEAVIVFFVLSGFLVGGKGLSRIVSGNFDWVNYFIDRFARIFLPLLGALVFFVIASIIQHQEIDWYIWFGNLFSLQGIFVTTAIEPLWSLSYEVWFYVILGAVGCLVTKSSNWLRYVAWIVLFICAYIFTYLRAIYLFIWLSGMIAYFFISQRVQRKMLAAGVFLFFVGLALSQTAFTSRAFPHMPSLSSDICNLFLAAAISICICQIAVCIPRSRFSIKLNDYSSHLAAFSYTLYLTHVVTFRLVRYYGFERSQTFTWFTLGVYFVHISVALAVAFCLYLCFEKHTKWFKNHIKRYLLPPKELSIPTESNVK